MSKEQDKKTALMDFTKKAAQRIQDKRVPQRGRYYVPSMDQEVLLRGLDKDELQTCLNMEDGKEGNDADRFSIYTGMVEPDLKSAAKEIMANEAGLPADQRTVQVPLDIVNCFSLSEVTDLALAVMELSGVIGKKVTKITDDLKN